MRRLLSIITLGLVVVLLVALAFFVPSRVIGTGIEEFPRGERATVQAALRYAEAETDPSDDAPYYLFVTARRVDYARKCPRPPGEPTDVDPEDGIVSPEAVKDDPEVEAAMREWFTVGRFSARVSIYTVFGLPYGEVSTGCPRRDSR